jgi:hypothetical protein
MSDTTVKEKGAIMTASKRGTRRYIPAADGQLLHTDPTTIHGIASELIKSGWKKVTVDVLIENSEGATVVGAVMKWTPAPPRAAAASA